eukprot:7565031-Lingulodinium_polyedra.AAC.1
MVATSTDPKRYPYCKACGKFADDSHVASEKHARSVAYWGVWTPRDSAAARPSSRWLFGVFWGGGRAARAAVSTSLWGAATSLPREQG